MVGFYNWFLDNLTIPDVSNTTTMGRKLQKFGKQYWGKKFHGVYMADEIPNDFNARKPFGIINLDPSDKRGSHWIAVAFQGKGKLLVYG